MAHAPTPATAAPAAAATMIPTYNPPWIATLVAFLVFAVLLNMAITYPVYTTFLTLALVFAGGVVVKRIGLGVIMSVLGGAKFLVFIILGYILMIYVRLELANLTGVFMVDSWSQLGDAKGLRAILEGKQNYPAVMFEFGTLIITVFMAISFAKGEYRKMIGTFVVLATAHNLALATNSPILKDRGFAGASWYLLQTAVNGEYVDVCPNLWWAQESVPESHNLVGRRCVEAPKKVESAATPTTAAPAVASTTIQRTTVEYLFAEIGGPIELPLAMGTHVDPIPMEGCLKETFLERQADGTDKVLFGPVEEGAGLAPPNVPGDIPTPLAGRFWRFEPGSCSKPAAGVKVSQ